MRACVRARGGAGGPRVIGREPCGRAVSAKSSSLLGTVDDALRPDWQQLTPAGTLRRRRRQRATDFDKGRPGIVKVARGEGHAGGGGGRGRARGRKLLGGPSSPILSEDSGAALCLRAPPAGPHFLAFFFLSLPFVVADFAATSASGAGRLLQAFLDFLSSSMVTKPSSPLLLESDDDESSASSELS